MWLKLLNLAQPSWQCVSKPRKQFSGFFNIFKLSFKTKSCQRAADHTNKEQRALALIIRVISRSRSDLQRTDQAGTENHIVYGNLAELCGMQGRFDELIQLLQSLTTQSQLPEAHNNLACSQGAGDLNAPITSYNTALELKPNIPEAHYNLGIALKIKAI